MSKCVGQRMFALIVLFMSISGNNADLMKSDKQHFHVGGWIGSSQEKMISSLKPLFEDYLTEVIGPLYDPPVDFKLIPLNYDSSSHPDRLIADDRLDFAYMMGGGLTCLEAQFGFSPIATQVSRVRDSDEECYGSVLYSLKSTGVANLTSFKGKRIGVGNPLSQGGFQLGAVIMFFMNDNERLMNAVLTREVDLAMTQSGWLESNFPEIIPKLQYHDVKNVTYRSMPYSLPTTTNLVPAFGLSASPQITLKMQEQILSALSMLNHSVPAAIAAGISTFILPASYERSRELVEKLDFMHESAEGKMCHYDFEDPSDLIYCPRGFSLEEPEVLHRKCEIHKLPCPGGITCFCQPCVEDLYLEIYPWRTVLGLCCTLFAIGLCFSIGWTSFLQSESLLVRLYRASKNFSRSVRRDTDSKIKFSKVPA